MSSNNMSRAIRAIKSLGLVLLTYLAAATIGAITIRWANPVAGRLAAEVALLVCALPIAIWARLSFRVPQGEKSSALVLVSVIALYLTFLAIDIAGAFLLIEHGTAVPKIAEINFATVIEQSIVSPIVEEILFTGFLFTAIRSTSGIRGALLVTAAMFTLMHLPGNLQGATSRLLYMSASICLYMRFNTLLPSICLHILGNCSLVILERNARILDALFKHPISISIAWYVGVAIGVIMVLGSLSKRVWGRWAENCDHDVLVTDALRRTTLSKSAAQRQ